MNPALNQVRGLITSAPESLRAALRALGGTALTARCAGLRIDERRLDEP